MIMDKPTYSLFQDLQTPHLEKLSFAKATIKDVSLWVSNLSLMQLGDTSRTLFEALIEIRNLKCEETLRYELVEILRPALSAVIESLEKQFLHQGFITNERNEQVIELVIQLRFHWSMIYLEIARRVHERLLKDDFGFFAFKLKKDLKNTRVLATYQAVGQISGLIFQHQILYHDYPIGIWLASHQLYAMAEKEGYHNLNISQFQTNTNAQLSSVHLMYSQILLLNILNPNQLRQSEIQSIYLCSFDWCKLIQLTNTETPTSNYIIDKEKDLPPIHNNHIQQVYESHFFINTQKLLEHVNQSLTKNASFLSKTEKMHLNAPIKFHLQNILGNVVERRHERYEYNAPIDMCFGLSTAHFYLSHGKNFNESLDIDGRFDLQSNSQILQKWNEPENIQENQQINRMNRQIYSANVMDISVNGYRLKWTGEVPKSLRTGELVLVKENAQLHWRLAVIRWIKQTADKNLELGLEILAQEIYPIAVTIIADKNTINYHPALLLTNQLFEQRKNTIIVPGAQMFKAKQSVTIRFQTNEIKIYLEQSLLITQSFNHFEFDLFDDVHSAMIEAFKEHHASLSKSKDIWDALK